MSSVRLVLWPVVLAALAAPAIVAAQQWPMCATGSLNPAVTDVVWMPFGSRASYLALNSTTGGVLCTVAPSVGFPSWTIGSFASYVDDAVFSITQTDTDPTNYLFRVDTYDFKRTLLCSLPDDLLLLGVWAGEVPHSKLKPSNTSAQLVLLAQSGNALPAATPVDVYDIDWTHSSPASQCVLRKLSSLDANALGIIFAGAGTVDWTARELYGVMTNDFMTTEKATDSVFLARWSLDTGVSSVVNVTFSAAPTPNPNARYLLELLAAAPVDGADNPQTVYAYWIDANTVDQTFWGTLDVHTGVLTAIATSVFGQTAVVTIGISNPIFNAETQDWQLTVSGQYNVTDPPGPLDFRLWQLNPVTGAAKMSDSLVSVVSMAVLRPNYPPLPQPDDPQLQLQQH